MRILFIALLLGLQATSAQQPNTLIQSIRSPPLGVQKGAQLGSSVAVEGGFAVIGVPLVDFGAIDSGVVKVFSSTTGELLHVLPNPTPGVKAQFTNFLLRASLA